MNARKRAARPPRAYNPFTLQQPPFFQQSDDVRVADHVPRRWRPPLRGFEAAAPPVLRCVGLCSKTKQVAARVGGGSSHAPLDRVFYCEHFAGSARGMPINCLTFCGKSRHVPVLPLENSVSGMAARDTNPSAACAASLVRVEFDRGGAGARLVHEGQLLRRATVDGCVDGNGHGAGGVERVGEAEQRCAVVSNGEPHLHAHTQRDKDVTYVSALSE